MPGHLLSALNKTRTVLGRVDVPLARRHDLERSIAFFVELHRVHDASRLADKGA